LKVLIERVKKHLQLVHVRVAAAGDITKDVRTVGVCAGSGGEVLNHIKADVLLTGEMRHHDVLAAVAKGTSVILCEHTNTERGYLKVLRTDLEALFEGKVAVQISAKDSDPLVVV